MGAKHSNTKRTQGGVPEPKVYMPQLDGKVMCSIFHSQAKAVTCSMCGLGAEQMRNLFRLMNDKFTADDSPLDNAPNVRRAMVMAASKLATTRSDSHNTTSEHCTNCQSTFCDCCGALIAEVLRNLCPWTRFLNGVSSSGLQHPHCPNCNDRVRTMVDGLFCKFLAIVQQYELFHFDIDAENPSFVIVSYPNQGLAAKLLQVKSAAARITPMTFRDKEKMISQHVEILEKNLCCPVEEQVSIEELSALWFFISEMMYGTQKLTVSCEKLNRVQVVAKACDANPKNVKYLSSLSLIMSNSDTVKLGGKQVTVILVAAAVCEAVPLDPEAWRNLGIILDIHEEATVDGNKVGKYKAFCRSMELAPDNESGLYACAFGSRPTWELPVKGTLVSRSDILRGMLDSGGPEESLEEMVGRHLGPHLVLPVTSELSLLFPEHPLVMKLTAQYEVDENNMLGSGAFGSVFEAVRRYPDGTVRKSAAKLVKLEFAGGMRSLKSCGELCLATVVVFQEVITKTLLVAYDTQTTKTTMFMEFADYGSTYHYMKKMVGSRLYEGEVRSFFHQVLVALTLLHRFGVVHQDIKPMNILVFEGGQVKLADFGVSAMLNCKCMEKSNVAAGTEIYMPPEAFNQGVVARSSDIWSLACTIIELGSFNRPAPDPDYLRVPKAAHPFRPFVPTHFSDELKQILHRCLDYDYRQRPTAAELVENPYFSDIALPPSAETTETFEAARHVCGVPQQILEMEALSTMGLETRRDYATMLTTRRGIQNSVVPE